MAILSLDQGTTSSRAILFDRQFKPLGQINIPLAQHYPKEGWVEHDAMEIFHTQMQAAGILLANSNETIDCIGITNQRETTILWNADTGKPIAPAIVWQCRRTAPQCEALIAGGLEHSIKQITGLPVDAYFSATKIAWLLSNSAEARALAAEGKLRFGTVECWLIWKLTGNHYTDVTNASRTMLMNITTMEWDTDLCRRLGIPMSILPKIGTMQAILAEFWKIKRFRRHCGVNLLPHRRATSRRRCSDRPALQWATRRIHTVPVASP